MGRNTIEARPTFGLRELIDAVAEKLILGDVIRSVTIGDRDTLNQAAAVLLRVFGVEPVDDEPLDPEEEIRYRDLLAQDGETMDLPEVQELIRLGARQRAAADAEYRAVRGELSKRINFGQPLSAEDRRLANALLNGERGEALSTP